VGVAQSSASAVRTAYCVAGPGLNIWVKWKASLPSTLSAAALVIFPIWRTRAQAQIEIRKMKGCARWNKSSQFSVRQAFSSMENMSVGYGQLCRAYTGSYVVSCSCRHNNLFTVTVCFGFCIPIQLVGSCGYLAKIHRCEWCKKPFYLAVICIWLYSLYKMNWFNILLLCPGRQIVIEFIHMPAS